MRALLNLSYCFLLILPVAWGQRSRNPVPTGDDMPRKSPVPEKNPFDSPRDIEKGGALFQVHCSYCHGTHGEGGRGAELTSGQYRYGGSDADLFTTIRNGIPGSEMPPARASDDEDIWRITAFVKKLGSAGLEEKASGDPAAGKIVYDGKGGCAACHAIGKKGSNLGPDLTDVGRRRGLAFLRESLEKPEAYVAINYRAIRVTPKSGQTVAGIRLNEDDISIQLRDVSDNLRSFLKENIKEIRHDQPSLMPSYKSALDKKEMEDLIAYLSSLRGAP